MQYAIHLHKAHVSVALKWECMTSESICIACSNKIAGPGIIIKANIVYKSQALILTFHTHSP